VNALPHGDQRGKVIEDGLKVVATIAKNRSTVGMAIILAMARRR
jgi:hypothetical protein